MFQEYYQLEKTNNSFFVKKTLRVTEVFCDSISVFERKSELFFHTDNCMVFQNCMSEM